MRCFKKWICLLTLLLINMQTHAQNSNADFIEMFQTMIQKHDEMVETMVDMLSDEEKLAMQEERAELVRELEDLRGNTEAADMTPDSQTVQLDEVNESEQSASESRVESAGANASTHPSGLAASQVRGVYYYWGKKGLSYSAALGMSLVKYEGGGVYLILKDGTAIFQPEAPLSDLDLNAFKRANPDKITQLKHLADLEEQYIYPPRERGYTLDIYVERPSTSASSARTFSTWKKLRLTKDGRFEMGQTKLTSTSHSLDTTYGAENTGTYASSADKTGRFTAGSANLIGAGTSMVRRATGNTGEFTGTYLIDGNTIELRYDNGAVFRSLFGTNGKDRLILGDTNYWTPSE